MNDDELRTALRQRADDVAPASSGLPEVVARARVIRRRRRIGVTAAAAVVVAAIAVPVGLGLGDHDRVTPSEPTPSRSVAPSPAPTTSSSPKPTNLPASLAAIPQGPAPAWDYAVGRTVHLTGGRTAQLPGSGNVTTFASYHGGWLVSDGGNAVQYDNSGTVVARGSGWGNFVVSSDGTRVGYTMAGKVYAGLASGMSDGQDSAPIPETGHAVGFIGAGLLYDKGPGDTSDLVVLGGNVGQRLAAIDGAASAATDAGDLVAGATSRGDGIVVSADTGKTMWSSSDWLPFAFSPDGRYVAATEANSGAGYRSLAILDAHRGAVIAQASVSTAITMNGPPVIDGDGNLLVVATTTTPGSKPTTRAAVLRLTQKDRLERATTIVSSPGGLDQATLIALAAGPS